MRSFSNAQEAKEHLIQLYRSIRTQQEEARKIFRQWHILHVQERGRLEQGRNRGNKHRHQKRISHKD